MSRIGLVVNPAAGRGRAAAAGPVVADQLRAAGHDVVDLTTPDVTSARARTAAFLQAPGADALVGVGGDGVVNLAVNAILTHAPHVPLGLVAAGTGNDTARSLGLDLRDPVTGVAHVVAALTRPPRRLDVGEITTLRQDATAADGDATPDGVRRFFLNVLSAGIDAAVNGRANRISRPRGPARYVIALAAELAAFRGFDVRVVADGVDLGDAGTLLAVANSRSIGGGMQIAPDASWTDGQFDVVTARTIPRRTLLRVFPRVYGGTHLSHPAVSVTRASEVHLLPGPGTERRLAPPPLVHADGEPVGRVPLRLRVVPGALAVLA
ncbi:diacylglycerol kinase [Serinibacter arcticus]|uniref:Diacylglycerol kinase n=1 Tax=Serinibacter arcticus TaxID=1655435 RepID=A0A2U1ZRZ4_9MICO|nr:diacylglycerol kinase family protein [Serinibacter arcticus]PWD49713.1 diacylglycerol kinase [Serinibacter arcticus]